MDTLKKQHLLLKWYAVSLTGILAYVLLTGFNRDLSNQRFDEITVERINIVEPDGRLKMVISNQTRQHPGMMDGLSGKKRNRAPGILFFNEEQDEIGGLGFHGNKELGGNNLILSFDQYKEDQIMQLLQYSSSNGDNKYGLQLWERDKNFTMNQRMKIMDSLEKEGYNYRRKLEALKDMNNGKPLLESRMFVGKQYNGETGLFLQDQFGHERLRFYIDSTNTPKLELLDDQGNLIRDLLMN